MRMSFSSTILRYTSDKSSFHLALEAIVMLLAIKTL